MDAVINEYGAWAVEHGAVAAAAFAMAALAVSLLGVYVLVRLPSDFLDRAPPSWPKRSVSAYATFAMRNLLACGLVAIGVVLTPLPGPGLVTIALGLALSDLPVRDRLLRRLLGRRRVRACVNDFRRRLSRPPLVSENFQAPRKPIALPTTDPD